MWTLIRREWNDNAPILLIGIGALIGLMVVTLISEMNTYNTKEVEQLGLPQSLEGMFNTGLLGLSLLATALGVNQLYKDRTKKISAFLVTLATTRQQVFLAKILAGVIFVFFGIVISSIPIIVMLKIRPPLLPVDYSLLLMRLIFAFCFALIAYLLGLAVGSSKSNWGLIVLPLFLLVLLVAMLLVPFSSPVTGFVILVLMGLAFLIYARQQFLRASL